MITGWAHSRIEEAVSRIASSRYAFVDHGIGQGREVIQASLSPQPEILQGFGLSKTDEERTDAVMLSIKEYLAELEAWVAPHHLPADYRFFIKRYGGLHIHYNGLYYFQAYGYGMQATYQYDIPMDGDDSHYENGLLVIGTLTLHEKAHAYYNRPIYFISDLGGRVQQGCVLAMPSGEWKRFPAIHDIEDVMRDLVTYRDCWTKVADSFTDWLEEVASTQGTLGYIPVREP